MGDELMANRQPTCLSNGYKYNLVEIGDPKFEKRKKYHRILLTIALVTVKLGILIFILVFIILPLIFKFTYKFQRAVVFLNFVNVPSDADYNHPNKYGFRNARNFYIETDEGIRLGVWQILAENITHSLNENETTDQYYDNILRDGNDIVIYFHGNAGTRLTEHRLELYNVLKKHFHVFAFDYRSYGDSSNVDPSEAALVKDCVSVYEWVSNRTGGNIFIWAHSLGTSVAVQAVVHLQEKGIRPTGVVLEAPFNNLREETSEFPLARPFRSMPWFSYTIIEPLQESGFKFETDKHICKVDAPIKILHAEDDTVVPFKLGHKLFEAASNCRTKKQGKITFLKLDGRHKYNHRYICRYPKLLDVIGDFTAESIQAAREKQLLL